jgi:hypothetical protein
MHGAIEQTERLSIEGNGENAMRMKSVSSLILMFGIFGYIAMQIGMRGPAAARLAGETRIAAPQRTEQRVLPPRYEKLTPRPAQIYFATAR